jgi:hypothetical protein
MFSNLIHRLARSVAANQRRGAVLALFMTVSPTFGAERVRFVLQGPTGTVNLDFVQRTAAEDNAFWNGQDPSSGKTRRQDKIDTENSIYGNAAGWAPLPDGTDVNGYNIGTNQPTNRQICAGLAVARLIGGPYKVPAQQADEVISKFGQPVAAGNVAVGDIAVWRDGGTAKHFAIVCGKEVGVNRVGPYVRNIFVWSKDDAERVYKGPVATFPKNYGRVSYYHLNWTGIKVTRINADAPTANFAGAWNTGVGKYRFARKLTLTQNGNKVSGSYTFDWQGKKHEGKIEGTVTGNTLAFKWTEAGRGKGSDTGEFTMAANGKGFSGSYKGEPGCERGNSWVGWR